MLRIFYFSGTGNARNVAHWMAREWRARGREAEVVDIAQAGPGAVRVDPGDEIGLASPTHGFNFPPITLRFLLALPRTPHANRAYVLNTRGGVRLLGVPLPGLSGAAQILAALVLLAKGYRVAGMRSVDLPSNWISLHPGLREHNVRALYERGEAAVRRFAGKLLDGKRDLRALWDLPQDLLIAPVALGYYFIGRFVLAKSFVSSRACDACGACVRQCPVQALRLVRGRPFWTYRCESCMRCMNLCPKRAIQTAHGFIAGLVALFSLSLAELLHPVLPEFPAPAWPGAGILLDAARFTLESALLVAVLFLAYRLLHFGLGIRLVERFAVLTSLTRFAFWRRYRAPREDAPDGMADEKPEQP